MLNTADGFYETKRTSSLLKIKKFYSSDCLVLSVLEGTGKYEKSMGGVLIEYKGETLSVGSGFTDEQREYFWENKDDIIGKVIEVQYFSESTNQKDDKISLRFPTFKGLVFKNMRPDKTKDDVNYE